MLETAVGDGSEKLRLQQEIAKARSVDTNITPFLIRITSRYGEIALLGRIAVGSCRSCGSRGSFGCLEFLVRVVDEIFLVRHDD